MESISAERRSELVAATKTSLWKLELRDQYGIDAARRALSPEEAKRSMAPLVAETAEWAAAGIKQRRIKTISEPPSAYMRGAYDLATLLVDAGEDIRWLPRRLTADLFLPGNDMFVVDGEFVMFNVLDGDGNPADQLWDDDPTLVKRCQEAFKAAWAVAVPHRDYQPA